MDKKTTTKTQTKTKTKTKTKIRQGQKIRQRQKQRQRKSIGLRMPYSHTYEMREIGQYCFRTRNDKFVQLMSIPFFYRQFHCEDVEPVLSC